MEDDFNTPVALSAIFKAIDEGNKIIDKNIFFEDELRELFLAREFIKSLPEKIFGLDLTYAKTIDEDIRLKIEERNDARKNKDFKKSDEIRDQLLSEGIILEDTKEGTEWRRKA